MPQITSIADAAAEVAAWRHDLHRHPELMYDLPRTSALVADKLRAFGCDEVATGVGRSGVVGVIRGKAPGNRAIGLRADMDALPITEASGTLPHASTTPGRMHACGHDGHTAMLLGAARHLCDTRDFAGTAVVIFQPAEEGGAGARAMLDDGLMTRFGIDEVFALHNLPGLPIGQFALRPGPIMASTDRFEVTIAGHGGHAAMPHLCRDPLLAGAAITCALQAIVARNVDPLDACVVSVTQFAAGTAGNAIAETARLSGTVRTLKPETRRFAEQRLREVASGVAAAYGVTATTTYHNGYPVTINDPGAARFAAGIAAAVAGPGKVNAATEPMMGAEDFSYMLEARPGAFAFIGNGDSAGLHHPAYDFDDRVLPYGMRFWVGLVEAALPASVD